MVAWFAGLFYIFRLFVYHAKHRNNPELAAVYTVMEKKLLRIIMIPAMILTMVFGFLLIVLNPAVLRAGWFYGKLGGVAFLVAYQVLAVLTQERFSRGDYWLSEKACRIINEVPTLILVWIVILAVVKP